LNEQSWARVLNFKETFVGKSELPSIEQLRTFLFVADTGIQTEAGKLLGVKQPDVSRRLKQLNKLCQQDPVTYSDGNRVRLTTRGREILPAIRSFVLRYDDLKSSLLGKRPATQILRVASGSSASQFYLARAIALFRQQTPDWTVETRATRGESRVTSVVDGSMDLAIVSHDRLQVEMAVRAAGFAESAVCIEEFARQGLCVIAAKESSEAAELKRFLKGQQVPVRMLCRWSLIGLDQRSGVRRQIEQMFATSRERPRFTSEAGGWLAVKQYVTEGLGVGLLPLALLTPDDLGDLIVSGLSSDITIRYSLVYRQDADPAGLQPLKMCLKKAATDHETALRKKWAGKIAF
jgi:DNA-binding transcriptional LysR family regulator